MIRWLDKEKRQERFLAPLKSCLKWSGWRNSDAISRVNYTKNALQERSEHSKYDVQCQPTSYPDDLLTRFDYIHHNHPYETYGELRQLYACRFVLFLYLKNDFIIHEVMIMKEIYSISCAISTINRNFHCLHMNIKIWIMQLKFW